MRLKIGKVKDANFALHRLRGHFLMKCQSYIGYTQPIHFLEGGTEIRGLRKRNSTLYCLYTIPFDLC